MAWTWNYLIWKRIQENLHLSGREVQISRSICRGRKSNAIARELRIEVSTVNTHRERLYRKLGVHDCASLVLRLVSAGLSDDHG